MRCGRSGSQRTPEELGLCGCENAVEEVELTKILNQVGGCRGACLKDSTQSPCPASMRLPATLASHPRSLVAKADTSVCPVATMASSL